MAQPGPSSERCDFATVFDNAVGSEFSKSRSDLHKEIAEAARIEDRNHFEALVPRIYELGGALPKDMRTFHDMSACPPAFLPEDPEDVGSVLNVLVEAERCAVRG